MSFYRVSLNIPEDEFRLIKDLASKEVRPVRDQIRFMLKISLELSGLLPPEETKQPAVNSPWSGGQK